MAPDLRGHGLSDSPDEGYDTAAAGVAAVNDRLGLTDERLPVVAYQSRGGNVVLDLRRHASCLTRPTKPSGIFRIRAMSVISNRATGPVSPSVVRVVVRVDGGP